jgi:ubiquinone/menaquinone biosynthesis C-methylase UbiE
MYYKQVNMPATALSRFFTRTTSPIQKDPYTAYELWAGTYDLQKDNLMLKLDEEIFRSLLSGVDIKNKFIADIGCGTGRHWKKMYEEEPALLTGFDISPAMLSALKNKFPQAHVFEINDETFSKIPDKAFDLLVSTLTIAHIENIEETIATWSRIVADKGEIILTDFHPELLASGGLRSFSHGNKTIAVINYIHPLQEIENILSKHRFPIVKKEQRFIDSSVKKFYEEQKAMDVYEKYKGMPVIYGLHLKRV